MVQQHRICIPVTTGQKFCFFVSLVVLHHAVWSDSGIFDANRDTICVCCGISAESDFYFQIPKVGFWREVPREGFY